MTRRSGREAYLTDVLCQFQEIALETVLAGIYSDSPVLPTTLLYGPPGIGKLTVARVAAERIGIPFLEIRLDQARSDVQPLLFGQAGGASAQSIGLAQFGLNGPVLVYLSHVENVDGSVLQPIANMLMTRTYSDAAGVGRTLSPETWICCGLTVLPTARVGPTHWLTSRFRTRIPIHPQLTTADFHSVASAIARLPSREVEGDVGATLQSMAPADNFHAVVRWVSTAMSNSPIGPISTSAITEASVQDLDWAISRVEYKGKRLQLRHVRAWLSCIDEDLRPVAVHMVRQLALHYFISVQEYFAGVSNLCQQSDPFMRGTVSFCKWQPTGKSSPHFAHELKNHARWRIVDDVDLAADPATWPQYRSSPTFILADDFVGTGQTLASLTKGGTRSPLAQLASKYQDANFVLLLFVAFDKPLLDARQELRALLGDRIHVLTFKTLSDEDRCFSSESIIVPVTQQEALKRFCVKARRQHYNGLHKRFLYGFEQTAAFFAFYNGVPNNSLPLLWHDQGDWLALLPASGSLT